MSATDGRSMVNQARRLAAQAHYGQVDKAGEPYMAHVERVASACAGDPVAETVAWLHDVLEDAESFAEQVHGQFPHTVVYACVLLNRGSAPTPEAYYSRIRANPLALKVKLADIADNSDPQRLARLDAKTATRLRRKYAQAREALLGEAGRALHVS